MTTGEKIARCRKNNGMTQERLAEILGVTRQAVSRWEGDIAFPETDNLTKMAKLFSVSVDWLLNYEAAPDEGRARVSLGTFGRSFNIKDFYFEFKSKTHIGGLPLVHVNIGLGRVAKGVFSFGFVAAGIFSFGLAAAGLFAFGVLGLGFLVFASVALGAVSFGGVAIGVIALGGLAVGLYSMGGCAIGAFAVGGYANGSIIAIGDVAVGGIAVGDTRAEGSIISVLKADYFTMKDELFKEFAKLPKGWSLFTSWCRGLANIFMTN